LALQVPDTNAEQTHPELLDEQFELVAVHHWKLTEQLCEESVLHTIRTGSAADRPVVLSTGTGSGSCGSMKSMPPDPAQVMKEGAAASAFAKLGIASACCGVVRARTAPRAARAREVRNFFITTPHCHGN
jgi:hypothetical protein